MWLTRSTRIRRMLSVTFALACTVNTAGRAAELATTDKQGRLHSIFFNEEYVDIRTDLRLPTIDWKSLPGMTSATDTVSSREGTLRKWSGRIEVNRGQHGRYIKKIWESGGIIHLNIQVTAEEDISTEGVYYWIDIPVACFGGGQAEITGIGRRNSVTVLPQREPMFRHLMSAMAVRASFRTAERDLNFDVTLSKPCFVIIQDNRVYQVPMYSAIVELHKGSLKKGQSVWLKMEIRASGTVDRRPAHIFFDPDRKRQRFDGFGGNYCFAIDSPATQYTLQHLRMAWVRTEMSVHRWEPQNDDASASTLNWEFFRKQDDAGSHLRREFLLKQTLEKRGHKHVVSIWHLPDWIYENPERGHDEHRRKVPRANWPELVESITSYLLHAKKEYGVEPDLFSFNEPDIGVFVLFTPEEHRDFIKLIGRRFEQLGLKTRLLLGDVSIARGTDRYVAPTTTDPAALKYVGALSFHSWTGATEEQYVAWGCLAEVLGIPLLIGELGLDPNAWKTDTFNSLDYSLREARLYQEILAYARPQATMHWEFTSDYGIVKEIKGPPGQASRIVPATRFWFMKHFCNLTPLNATALGTTSDHQKVLFTAFEGKDGERDVITLHILNYAAARRVTLFGLPPKTPRLRVIRTTESESFLELPGIVSGGKPVILDMPARSFTTLTTMPRGPLP